jgi:hypothetical protein
VLFSRAGVVGGVPISDPIPILVRVLIRVLVMVLIPVPVTVLIPILVRVLIPVLVGVLIPVLVGVLIPVLVGVLILVLMGALIPVLVRVLIPILVRVLISVLMGVLIPAHVRAHGSARGSGQSVPCRSTALAWHLSHFRPDLGGGTSDRHPIRRSFGTSRCRRQRVSS